MCLSHSVYIYDLCLCFMMCVCVLSICLSVCFINQITVISLLHALFAYALFYYHCPALSESAPSWVYALVACFIFIYQLLDAIDGKQARRTGTGSPLGQLFDHGCDAITAFVSCEQTR